MRYVTLGNKRYAMREVLRLYKEQRAEERRQKQLTLSKLATTAAAKPADRLIAVRKPTAL